VKVRIRIIEHAATGLKMVMSPDIAGLFMRAEPREQLEAALPLILPHLLPNRPKPLPELLNTGWAYTGEEMEFEFDEVTNAVRVAKQATGED
jgi:hypothetical protein